ncbi:hypothetical protein U1Q18_041289 [Sarracenia purpurea var. burkii]
MSKREKGRTEDSSGLVTTKARCGLDPVLPPPLSLSSLPALLGSAYRCGSLASAAPRLSAIAAEMGQLKNEIQERRRALNLFLRNVRARDPAEAEERIGAARENIRDLKRRLQVLQEEQQALIVRAPR